MSGSPEAPAPVCDLVVFDCDGVLVESEPIANRVLLELIADAGLRVTPEEADTLFLGRTLESCQRLVEERLGRELPGDFLQVLERVTHERFAQCGLPVVPGVREVLEGLPVPPCVASNSTREGLRYKLEVTGLLPYFQGRLYSFEEVERPKPDPALYLHAARASGAEPRRCVVVEDSPTGVAAGRAAGMRVYGYTAGQAGARALLEAAGAVPFAEMRALPVLLGLARTETA